MSEDRNGNQLAPQPTFANALIPIPFESTVAQGFTNVGQRLQSLGGQAADLYRAATGDPAAQARVAQASQNLGAGAQYLLAHPEQAALPAEFEAFHGTRALFNRFLDEFIGSGEGTQAFSYGHYVASNPDVARTYIPQGGQRGHLLNVWVKPEHEEFLDWNLPFSQQEPGVQDALTKAGLSPGHLYGPDMYPPSMVSRYSDANGREIYNAMAGDHLSDVEREGLTGEDAVKAAEARTSKQLSDAGIPGMRFLDRQSRNLPANRLTYTGSEPIDRTAQIYLDMNPGSFDNLRQSVVQHRDQLLSVNPGSTSLQSDFGNALDWLDRNKANFEMQPTRRTYNYVVYNPDNLEITHRNGQRLTPVDHDPFAGTP